MNKNVHAQSENSSYMELFKSKYLDEYLKQFNACNSYRPVEKWNNCSDYYKFEHGKYSGPFVNGVPEGKGEFKLNNGSVYIGEFKNGCFDGEGNLFYYNGDFYKGYFDKCNKHGTGAGVFMNGDVIKYEYNNNVLTNQSLVMNYLKPGFFSAKSEDKHNGYIFLGMHDGEVDKLHSLTNIMNDENNLDAEKTLNNYIDKQVRKYIPTRNDEKNLSKLKDGKLNIIFDGAFLIYFSKNWSPYRFSVDTTGMDTKDICALSFSVVNKLGFDLYNNALYIGVSDTNSNIVYYPEVKKRQNYQKMNGKLLSFNTLKNGETINALIFLNDRCPERNYISNLNLFHDLEFLYNGGAIGNGINSFDLFNFVNYSKITSKLQLGDNLTLSINLLDPKFRVAYENKQKCFNTCQKIQESCISKNIKNPNLIPNLCVLPNYGCNNNCNK